MNQSSSSLSESKQSKRLFFALWPDEKVVQAIQQQAMPYFTDCKGNMLKPSNWHITLAYFGASDAVMQACLEAQALKVKSTPFEVTLSLCGYWPKPKVAWLAPAVIPEPLKQLAFDLQHAIQVCGYTPETRDYLPHVSLVRKAKQAPAKMRTQAIPWQVNQFCLVESKSSAQGVEYVVLKRWDFL